ncbi:MAG: IclR family transcriptional regulator, partial [Dehalococcoidia bacterium]
MAATKRDPVIETEPDQLRSVERALAVLQVLAGQPTGVTPKEISRATNLHLSTVYRLLNTLVAAGYADRAATSGLFRLGPRIPQLHYAFLETLSPDAGALPLLQALQATTGETIHLCRLQGDNIVVTAKVEGSRPGFVPGGYLGFTYPAHHLAVGRVLLAWLPAAKREAFLA